MSAINKLTIMNFQSHRKTELEPAPAGQLTVITGPSDSGKTAILRALKWLYANRPLGTDFTRVGSSNVFVSLTHEDMTIARERSSGVNRYSVTGKNAPPIVLEGFGNEVPEEVMATTGVRPLTIGDVELRLNLAEQLDGPFLGNSISVGARAKVLGKLAGTEEIDLASKDVNTDLYRARREKDLLEDRIINLQSQLRDYDWLDRAEAFLRTAEDYLQELLEMEQEAATMDKLYRDWLQADKAQDQAYIALTKLEKQSLLFEQALNVAQQTAEATAQAERLGKLMAGWQQARDYRDRAARVTQALECLPVAEGELTAAQLAAVKAKTLYDLRNKLISADSEFQTWAWKANDLAEKLRETQPLLQASLEDYQLQAAWVSLHKKHKEATLGMEAQATQAQSKLKEQAYLEAAYIEELKEAGQCPLCGGDIKEKKIEEVLA